MSDLAVAQLLVGLFLIVVVSHTLAFVFGALRQPPMIGEILAGVILGPTVLGAVAPTVSGAVLPPTGVAITALQIFSQLGLLLLMFATGQELVVAAPASDRRTVVLITALGLSVPFAVGFAAAGLLNVSGMSGRAGSPVVVVLVFAIAIAVTSIPVISRIMLDLGLLETPFARVVLAVAAIEDVVLYAVLAVALSLGHAASQGSFGLWSLLGVDSVVFSVVYHTVASAVFFAGALLLGPGMLVRLNATSVNFLRRRSPIAYHLAVLLTSTLVCLGLNVNPVFGALLAGIATRSAGERGGQRPVATGRLNGRPPASDAPARLPEGPDAGGRPSAPGFEEIRVFALAFFIPAYFFSVGFRLDLARQFDPWFFAWFFLLACTVKLASVWTGARLAGRSRTEALDLAVALNARGGPGIVLATVALSAQLIDERFFTALVLLSIFTSQFAGIWLDVALRRRPRSAFGQAGRKQFGQKEAAQNDVGEKEAGQKGFGQESAGANGRTAHGEPADHLRAGRDA